MGRVIKIFIKENIMPGCTGTIIKKLKKFPVEKAAGTVIMDAALNAGVGCLASTLGANVLGFDRTTAAQMGAAGNAVFGAARSLTNYTWNYFTSPEENSNQENLQEEPKKSLREKVSNCFTSYTKIPEEAPPEQKSTVAQIKKGTEFVGKSLFLMGKYISYSVLGAMLGYAMLNMPSNYKIEDVAATSATGSALLAAMPIFIAAVMLCAPYCAGKIIDVSDKCIDTICCDSDDDIERQQRPRR